MTIYPVFSAVSRFHRFSATLRCAAYLSLATAALADNPAPTAIPVLVDTATGMTRGGQPYFVKGAGGSGHLKQLAARGANSIRTWNTAGLASTLDEAEKLGLTVSAGIWLEPECSWFSYQNPAHCAKQAERVHKEVILYRDHPALLAWGIGNEVEGDGTNTACWQQLNRLAQLVKELDPAHPTFTALAGIDPIKAAAMNTHVPHLDFVGINTYGGVFSLRQQLAKMGWKRPWMLTEWGPQGFWERPKTTFGAPLEQTSSEKATMLRRAYKAVISPNGRCLGSYVFLWGWKLEATVTWFGLLTHEGHTTASADALQEMWTGTKSANQAPAIENLLGVPKSPLPAGGTFDARVDATDPDGDTLIWHWNVLPEQQKHVPDKRLPMPAPIGKTVYDPVGDHVSVTVPEKPGIYRLHVWVKDGAGHAATANAPFEVR